MKYAFIALLSIILNLTSYGQQNRIDYIKKYQLLAIKEMNRSGIPASITMAQACLESGDGLSELARKSNNHFGIKCKSSWKGKRVYYDDDARNECFRKYKTVEESYDDHTKFLSNNPRYSFLFELEPTDYKGWARGLKKAGYATAGHYDKTLIKIIEDYKLYRLDYKMSMNEMAVYEQKRIGNDGISNSLTINPYRTHDIITINRLKAIVVKKGDTYQSIAQEVDKKAWELYRFNDLPKRYEPQPNEIVYIEKKHRRASKDNLTHKVEPGESMHYISQMYGIKLRPLYSRNDMKYGEHPKPGQILNLRKKKKD